MPNSRADIYMHFYCNINYIYNYNLKSLYELGARRVWVLSTLPLGCLPGGRTVAGGPLRICAPFANQFAQTFNGQLSSAVDSMRVTLPNYDIRFIDVYTPLFNLINNPQPEGHFLYHINLTVQIILTLVNY